MPLSAELEKIWLISGRKIRLRRKNWLNQENSSKFGPNEGIFNHFQKLEKCHKNPVFEKPGLETPPPVLHFLNQVFFVPRLVF